MNRQSMKPDETTGSAVSGGSRVAYLKGKRDQFALMIPVCLAFLAFVAYGCRELEAPRRGVLAALSVPTLWLALYVYAFVSTARKIRRSSGKDAA